MRTSTVLVILAGAVVAYLLAWPIPVEPVAWQPAPDPGLTGPFARNDRLAAVELLPAGGPKPEDVMQGPDGLLYTGLEDGRIVRFAPGEVSTPETFADTGGRPLGLQFDASGQLVVADAVKGLLRVSSGGQVTVLADEVDGKRMLFVDDLDIAADGTIWFSDASQRFGIDDYFADFWEGRATGRLLSHDPGSGETTVHLDGLHFANGVELGPDDAFVLVNETVGARIVRLWLSGPRAGQHEVFLDALPAYPDNLSFDGELFWVALPAARLPQIERFAQRPWLRAILARLPGRDSAELPALAWVIGVDTDGRVRHNLQDWSGRYRTVTSVHRFGGELYLGSIAMNAVGRVPAP